MMSLSASSILRRVERALSFKLVVIVCVLSMPTARAREFSSAAEGAVDANVRLFALSNNPVREVVYKLNQASPVPVNAEIDAKCYRPAVLGIANQTLGAVLTNIAALARCRVYAAGPCINLVDRAIADDAEHAMNGPLRRFDVENVPRSRVAGILFSRPEIMDKKFYITVIQHGKKALLDRPITLHLTNASPRDVLNYCVAGDTNMYWVIYRKDGYNFFGFYKR